ncbi:testis-expressed protein 47-like isoform X4 [Gopherus flavomarginatus]|uniref:testis-expressed protein 47-like isoform X4 n=1 Tax=Gopherus flavomarginatus TaxID=286002 RepID=UPI0021CC3473|nr:testis-expressed protein 47-like isoform X4 [Gopherus flavomarginatus]
MGARGGMAGREKTGQMKPKASPQEKGRTNLLQHMLSRRAPTAKEDTKLLLHRLVFLAKISPELADKQDLAGLQRGALLHPEGPARHAAPAAQHWSYKVLAVPSRHLGYDTSREEPVETITGECLAMLLKLGMYLLKYPKSPPNLPDVVLEEVPNLIIPQDTICHLLECRDLLSPAQFLQAYDSPLNVVMDSECVWPVPGKVKLDAVSS